MILDKWLNKVAPEMDVDEFLAMVVDEAEASDDDGEEVRTKKTLAQADAEFCGCRCFVRPIMPLVRPWLRPPCLGGFYGAPYGGCGVPYGGCGGYAGGCGYTGGYAGGCGYTGGYDGYAGGYGGCSGIGAGYTGFANTSMGLGQSEGVIASEQNFGQMQTTGASGCGGICYGGTACPSALVNTGNLSGTTDWVNLGTSQVNGVNTCSTTNVIRTNVHDVNTIVNNIVRNNQFNRYVDAPGTTET
jgi:hypothetical protein